jgi:hypothetical protein
MFPELIRKKKETTETDRRNRNWFTLFYLMPLAFEMKQTFRLKEIERSNVFGAHSLSFLL